MRGDIYRLPAPKSAHGHEQQGARYAVVVQSDDVRLSTALVAPTSRGSFDASFHPEIEMDGTRVRVLVEQTRVVDTEFLGAFAGRVNAFEMAEINRALRLVLDI